MTMVDQQRSYTAYKRTVTQALSLTLLGVLSACSEPDVSGVPVDTSQTSVTATPTAVRPLDRPSVSAAELADDSTVTLQAALAAFSEADTQPAVPVDPPAAATPEIVNPLTPAEEVVEAETVEPTDSSVAQPPVTDGITEPDDGSNSDSETESEAQTPDNEAANSNAGDGEQLQTSFVSITTSGFTGEVLDEAIRINWQADPDAIGYNVYKQAKFYTSVTTGTELIDTDVYDDDYYYEIEAWDKDLTRYYIATGLTISARGFGRTDPEAPQPNDALLEDYELVFADEFTNLTLDTSKWNTSFIWGTDVIINDEEQYYVDVENEPDFGYNPFTFDGENLTINTIETPDALVEKAFNKHYLSGIITSYDAFKFTYGYVETRAKFTHGRGYWPAFWLLNAYYVDASPEIDIMEFIGHNQDVVYHTYHYHDAQDQLRSTKSFPVPGTDYTADFHTFGVEWMPGKLIFYIDGVETYRIIDANVSQQEMYVIANQAVGGWWAGSPDETTPLPGKYVIDYIRVYQRITAHEYFQFDQPTDLIPLFIDSPGEVIPNKRPPFELWPEGYPDRQ